MFKYIMFSNGLRDVPIIFPKEFVHSLMSEAFLSIKEHERFTPVSAGELSIEGTQSGILSFRFICFGESSTLNLKSRSIDSSIVTNHPWEFGSNGFSMPVS